MDRDLAPMKNSSHAFALGVFLIAAVCAAAAFAWSVSFVYSKKAPVSRLEREIGNVAREEAYYRGLKKALAESAAPRAALDSYFVDPNNFVPFIEAVEALGVHAGVVLTVENAALVENDRVLALTLYARGGFSETLYFLSLLETFPAKISFDRAWVAKSADKKQSALPWEGRFIVKFATL
ncbi:hypothetical protein A3A38_01905 [Candidatus Kaiserbacteria bacterium RIFCSPLOWO2_01_FULL_53_17]|uniref:Uncharacterized protein n=1 Tax=Candidatus Kaiserbacteria bacterium RIFCSPLOWO2_01_FULL_53_17 TaxID=1798511 RepID=A0A1F6EHC5_9BACT|nr:MAG: hypothetical protein A3A38_01905 [Candidatus Kaiserbacteria bacterium RIFCSPLOWO2_01_FULL_53_17]